ncbi:MAG: magnesium transporter CorA family protein [Chloroflexota bacterium]|nr:magnesium transporter CorA family protein [Chloroflexota bacterium]
MPVTGFIEGENTLHIKQLELNGILWVNIESPTSNETEFLAQNYAFHHLDLDDCLSRIQRPKVDEYEEYLFIVMHFPLFKKDARVTVPSQLSIFIGENYLITLHSGELKPLVKLFRDCELHAQSRRENMRSPGYLLYRIVDRLVDYCLPILGKIMENIEQVEDALFSSRRTRETVYQLSVLRRDIISYRRIIWPMRAVVASLERRTNRFTDEDMEAYWGDVVDHVDKIWDTLDECKEIIEGLNDTSSSLYSFRTNEVIRVLTVISTIMLPLTVVTGFMGMNVPLPGGSVGVTNWMPFSILLATMLCVIVGMLVYFHRRNWI